MWEQALMAAAPSFGEGLGKSLGNTAAGPSSATLLTNPNFDSSGWNVSLGGGDISSSASRTTSDQITAVMPWAMGLLGLIVVIRALKK